MNLTRLARKIALPFAAFCTLLLVSPSVADAQTATVLRYNFDGAVGAPAAAAPGVTGSEFIRDGSAATFYDNTAGNPAPDANSNGWTVGAAANLALYYTFTITPAPGGTSWNGLTFDLANFDAAAINDGPTRFAVRSSLDGFTADLLTGAVGAAFATSAVSLNVTATSPVEYRIYGFAAGTTGGLLQVDNVALTSAVPEPSAAAVVILSAAALMTVSILRRTASPSI